MKLLTEKLRFSAEKGNFVSMSSRGKYFAWNRKELRELVPHNIGGFLSAFSSLSSPNFRLYFLGQCVSMCGTWIQSVAMSWLVYRLTGSIILLTTVAFVNQIPQLFVAPVAGVVSDRFNRYRIIMTTQILFMSQAFLLALLTLTGCIRVWHLVVLSLFNGMVSAMEAPARQSFYTKLVPPRDLSNAIALNSVTINGSRFIGPTIGGILVAWVGEGYCFLINGLSYVAVLGALLMMHLPAFHPRERKSNMLADLKDGIHYIRGFLPIRAVLTYVSVISFFGLPFMSIIPALVKDMLGGDSTLLGYMNSSIGAGALVAAFYLASRKSVKGLGKVVTIAAFMMGGSMCLLSLTHNGVVACLLAFPLGFALIGTMATSNTLLQSLVDDNRRGRVMSFFTMCFAGMCPVGGMVYGSVAETFSLSVVLLGAGIICIVTGAVYEYFRPIVRKATHDHYSHQGVVPEIASAIDDNYNNPF